MRWLLDEMLLPATADELNALGHDAIGVAASGLAETDDATIYAAAVDQGGTMVTENFADFGVIVTQRLAGEEPCVPLVFVRKNDFPRGSALASHLARHLHRRATDNTDPYPGPHWP